MLNLRNKQRERHTSARPKTAVNKKNYIKFNAELLNKTMNNWKAKRNALSETLSEPPSSPNNFPNSAPNGVVTLQCNYSHSGKNRHSGSLVKNAKGRK